MTKLGTVQLLLRKTREDVLKQLLDDGTAMCSCRELYSFVQLKQWVGKHYKQRHGQPDMRIVKGEFYPDTELAVFKVKIQHARK